MDSPETFALKKGMQTQEAQDLAKKLLPEIYNRLIIVLDTYMDTTLENKKIIALWIIGTYLHKQLPSFPRLFINAMKGSGKSRLLQILKALCWNATVQTNLSEAVLFRSASKQTLLFDESESISSKERGAMRELLNAGYKNGTQVTRMRKVVSKQGEDQIKESFDLYGPVALANINGMEDVLGDRCIPIILEKSKDQSKTMLLEDFDQNVIIKDLKYALSVVLVYKCSVMLSPESISQYNIYTLTTLPTLPTLTTLTTLYHLKPMLLEDSANFSLTEQQITFFKEIHEIGIDGRNFELFLPLLNISNAISLETFNDLKKIAKEFTLEKTKEDQMENRDWSLIDFVARQPQTLSFISVNELIMKFRDFYSQDDTEWLNSRWVGKALKRLNLTIDRRRLGKGVEYCLNVSKAQEKLKMFKMEEKKDG